MSASPKARRGLSLADAGREFWRHPTPWLFAVALTTAVAARITVGDWQLTDAVVPVAIAAGFPFLEWIIHVFVLHWRPRRVGRFTVDPVLARKHREHHVAPRDVGLVFIPLQSAIGAVAAAVVIAWLFPRTGMGLTFLVVILTFGLLYEWCHYLVHTDYKPKTAVYRAIWRDHRLHHFKNEHYWFGVTTPGTADRLLRTYPDPAVVPTSPTAKNLHAAM
ncbi:sterol desaturase family protein [Mycobacterium sp. CVI_P3]|uniref:Sterol desaturase family protein n=1 Tax=Mycobacterium pinniadriaticum TaxID=2994102 RepID=A0ABT3S923_9MYCO|nr:sterol desaturase family protein [Mycobacterium pinniadriaticum]MCX2929577.1 sterol desaturase family protein [Mycobacterium pinniadriaticum]MCX2936001.1 sterol desaturase family protein [Mycobacterium pinniadriaticum]